MTTYKELIQQRDALESQIRDAKRRETGAAIAQVQALVAEFDLTANDIFPSGKVRATRGASQGSKVAPKYRNQATGQTWTGRGKPPLWIANQDRDKYLIG